MRKEDRRAQGVREDDRGERMTEERREGDRGQ